MRGSILFIVSIFFITHFNNILLSSVFIDCSLDLGDKLLVEQDFLLHGTEISSVPFQLKLPPSLCDLHLLGLLCQLLLYVVHLALVYLLHLLVLILYDSNILLLIPCLHPKLIRVLMRTPLVLLAHLLLLCLCLPRNLSYLITEAAVLLPDRLGLLLHAPLLGFVLRHELDVIAHDLVVESLLLLQLLQHPLNLLGHLQVPHALLLLIARPLIPHLEQNALVVHALILDLRVQRVHLGTQLLGLVVRQVDRPQDVRSVHVVVDRRVLLVLLDSLPQSAACTYTSGC